ncbi:helix-turn-helix domain-containing protein [Raoultibacter phocaeensis]|uniref:helix-turn-helix domain-containing protein n=1 Tax=Raoultibacter phocaeensis TaxID=2479841 RepID=UPI00111B4D4B|nr:helix-turn-helix transcriptional regulator [Raoultibacter phocaeensis]
MDQVNFGTVLQDARIRKGYDLATAARRLRIRPDILQAIEASDFTRMPPRGYARNMVNAYARYLGLNPTEVTRMYLDEAYAYQVGRARSDTRQQSGFDMTGAAGSRRAARRDFDDHGETSALGRKLYVDDPHRDRRRAEASQTERHPDVQTHRSNRSALPNTQYTNFYSGPKASPLSNSKLPFIIAGAVILVLLVIVLVLVFGRGGTPEDDAPKLPVSGLTDPEGSDTPSEGSDSDESQTQTPAKVAPAKAVFKYEVGSDASPYIEIYVDGSDTPIVAENITGPASKEYDVTGTLRFVTTSPESVKVYQDGEELELADPNSAGVYQVTVDFAAVKQQWEQENGTASGDADGAANTNAADGGSGDAGDGDGGASA